MKAAIAIDDWKLPIFKRHLQDAGYQFEQYQGPRDNMLLLTVTTSSAVDLERVVRAAQTEAQRSKMQ